MHTTALYHTGGGGGLCQGDPSGQRPPWIKAPLDRDFLDRDPTQEGTWDHAARQEVTSYRDPLWTETPLWTERL